MVYQLQQQLNHHPPICRACSTSLDICLKVICLTGVLEQSPIRIVFLSMNESMNLSPGECTYWSFLNVANEEVLELFPSPYWRTCPCLSSVVMSGLCPILYSSFLKLQPWNDRLRDVTMYITVCLVNKTHGFECVCVCVRVCVCACTFQLTDPLTHHNII